MKLGDDHLRNRLFKVSVKNNNWVGAPRNFDLAFLLVASLFLKLYIFLLNNY